MSTPASADAPPSDALDHGSSGAPRYHAAVPDRHRVEVDVERVAREVRLRLGVLGPDVDLERACRRGSSVGSGRSTSAPGIVPDIVPSNRTADASRVAWSERASISLGSVTFSAGIARRERPDAEHRPGAEQRRAATMADHGEAGPDAGDGHRDSATPWRAARAPVDRCRATGSGLRADFGQTPRNRLEENGPRRRCLRGPVRCRG